MLSILFGTVTVNVQAVIPEICTNGQELGPLTQEVCDAYQAEEELLQVQYAYAVDNSDYDRIYKDASGTWHGVIEVLDTLLIYEPGAYAGGENWFYVEFSRDTKELVSITYEYETIKYCSSFMLFKSCAFDKWVDSYTDTEEVFNEYKDGSLMDYFGNESIYSSSLEDYDYRIVADNKDQFESINIVSFYYVLTDAEVIDLRLDIQQQYDDERNIIVENPLLSNDEKLQRIEQLNEEYEDYTVEFDEVLPSDCVGACSAVNEDPFGAELDPFWNKTWPGVQTWILRVLGAIIGIVLGGVLIYAIGLYISKLIVASGVGLTKSGTNTILNVGGYYGNKLFEGTAFFFKTLGNAFKSKK